MTMKINLSCNCCRRAQPDGALDDLDWKTLTATAEIVNRPRRPHELSAKLSVTAPLDTN